MILFFDTETTGKLFFDLPPEAACQPDVVQLAAVLTDNEADRVFGQINLVIEPPGPARWIPEDTAKIHGITDSLAKAAGIPRRTALSAFNHLCKHADTLVAHNIDFDAPVMMTAYRREGVPHRMEGIKRVCTMKAATPVLRLPKPEGWSSRPGDEFKWPKLAECYRHFFGMDFEGAHNAMNDVMAMVAVYQELRKIGVV